LCQICSSECLYCVDSSRKCKNSTSCADGFYYYSINSSCLSLCPNAYYADIGTQLCTQCHPGCSLCSGGAIEYCTKCRIDTTPNPDEPYYKYADHTICNTSCSVGYYEKLLTLTC